MQQPALEDAEWNFDLNPGETKKFSYKLRLDGFTNMPPQWFEKDNQASYVGMWDNHASVDSFSATEGGSPVFEQPITAADGVTFTRTYIGVSKFPAQPGRTTADLRPFNVTSTQFATSAMSDGGHYNWWGHSNLYGNNYGGGWYDQPDADPYPPNYVEDPLTPYALRRTDIDDIWNSRGVVFMRQVDEECGTRGWNQCGIYYSANLGSNPDRTDLWNLSLDNPDNWAPSLHRAPDRGLPMGDRSARRRPQEPGHDLDRRPTPVRLDLQTGLGRTDRCELERRILRPDRHQPRLRPHHGRLARPDPDRRSGGEHVDRDRVCNPANYGETGPTLTWTFEQDRHHARPVEHTCTSTSAMVTSRQP